MFLLSFLIPDFTLPKSYIIFQLIILTFYPLLIHSINYYFILIHKYLFVLMYMSFWPHINHVYVCLVPSKTRRGNWVPWI